MLLCANGHKFATELSQTLLLPIRCRLLLLLLYRIELNYIKIILFIVNMDILLSHSENFN
jgi:hypothetical protein